MKTILILDDEPVVRQSMVDYFEDCLWYPVQAESGEAALTLLQHQQPIAAIVDVRLPGMDGHKFIREAYRIYPSMVFLICTGSPEYRVPLDLRDLPKVSNQVFKKPVGDLRNLENEVLRLIEGLDYGGNQK